MARTEHFKRIVRFGRGDDELFDLVGDPRETCNLVAELTLVWLSPSIERVGKVYGWFDSETDVASDLSVARHVLTSSFRN